MPDDLTAKADDSWIPEAEDFTPGVINLKEVLDIAATHTGDRKGLRDAIWAKYFTGHAERTTDPKKRKENQLKSAGNVLIGMNAYGVWSSETEALTPLGEELRVEPNDGKRNAIFARHILKNCNGLRILRVIERMQARQAPVGKITLEEELRKAGFRLSRATAHHTKLLQWLREADILPQKGYDINQERLHELVGMTTGTVAALNRLTRPQRSFLATLWRYCMAKGVQHASVKEILDQMKFEQSATFKQDQVPTQIIKPLAKDGWIEHIAGSQGRGSRSGDVKVKEALMALDLQQLTGYKKSAVPPDVQDKLDTPLDQILDALESEDTHLKGVALELLALRIINDIALVPIRFRARSKRTHDAEIDLIAEGLHLHFSRWMFQCKNTTTVTINDLAKEIGLAVLMHAHVIVLVTTGRFARTVTDQQREISAATHLQVILVSGEVLQDYRKRGAEAIQEYFHKQAGIMQGIKQGQVEVAAGPTDSDE